MSVEAHAWAKGVRTGSPTLKAVLVAIADYADRHGYGWPKQEALAADTEFSLRAVRNAIAGLEDAGLLTRKARWREDGSRRSDGIQLSMTSEGNRHEVPDDDGQPARDAGYQRDQPAPRAGGTGTSFHHNRHEVPDSLRSNHQSNRQEERKIPAAIPETLPPEPHGTRIPVDFGLRPEARRTCEEFGLRGRDLDETLAEFHDHFVAVPRERGLSCDWIATLRNWLRRSERRRPPARASPQRPVHRNPYLAVLNEDRERPDARDPDRRAEDRTVPVRAIARH